MTRTVQSLLQSAQRALHEADLTRPEWTWAEIHSARLVGGPTTRRIVGDLGWHQWRVSFVEVDRGVRQTLVQHGMSFEAGMSALFLARVVVNRRFGFQVELFDVLVESIGTAPSVERQEALRARIVREGWSARQKRLTDPGLPAKVALVSSSSSQGAADFVHTLNGLCHVQVVEALMSGESAAASVANAIGQAASGTDLVVVARGGGAVSGLEWANDQRVVEAVATSITPVWVALGHAGDRHLVDEVAQRSFATPTQAAAELRRRAEALTAAARESELDHRRREAEQRTMETEQRATTRVRRAVGVAVSAAVVACFVLILALVQGAG